MVEYFIGSWPNHLLYLIFFFWFVYAWWVFIWSLRQGSPVDTYTRRHSSGVDGTARGTHRIIYDGVYQFLMSIFMCVFIQMKNIMSILTPFFPHLCNSAPKWKKSYKRVEKNRLRSEFGFITITYSIVGVIFCLHNCTVAHFQSTRARI